MLKSIKNFQIKLKMKKKMILSMTIYKIMTLIEQFQKSKIIFMARNVLFAVIKHLKHLIFLVKLNPKIMRTLSL